MALLTEIKNFIAYKRLAKERKNILVYSEHGGYTNNFLPIINVLTQRYGQSVCYVTSDPSDGFLSGAPQGVTCFYIDKLLSLFLALIDSPICLMTMPDLEVFHLKRSVHKVHYIYVFHALMSTHMVYRFSAFDHYDTILCVGPYQMEEIRSRENKYDLPAKNLVEAGYTRLDCIREQYREYVESRVEAEGKTALLAPGWQEGNIAELYAEEVVASLLGSGFRVIFRCHPEMARRRPDIMERYDRLFGNEPRVFIEKFAGANDSFFKADVLITDWSGVALEYAFGTERPVVFLDTPRKVHNPRCEELGITPFEVTTRSQIGVVLEVQERAKVGETARNLLSQGTAYRERITALRDRYIFNLGTAAEKSAEAVMARLYPPVACCRFMPSP
ncbi:MAG: CDP-glycerol glycerophosphotransferase family protein [Synergistaceae bacterium]|jgi:YidC/Oxa1 family membrane protein insertase|nr:CDP-glycerol glycerophosphotransferase family protein [Synergistaceae bacterium]